MTRAAMTRAAASLIALLPLAAALLFTPAALLITAAGGAAGEDRVGERVYDQWYDILHAGKRIGRGHSEMQIGPDRVTVAETLRMRIRTLGISQDVAMAARAVTAPDFSLLEQSFSMVSGAFRFDLEGRAAPTDGTNAHADGTNADADADGSNADAEGANVDADVDGGNADGAFDLTLRLGGGVTRRWTIPMPKDATSDMGLVERLLRGGMAGGERRTWSIFDPVGMGFTTMTVAHEGGDTLSLHGVDHPARRILMVVAGLQMRGWYDAEGLALMQEGPMGLIFERPAAAVADASPEGPFDAGPDWVEAMALPSDKILDDPSRLKTLRLRIIGPGAPEGVIAIHKKNLPSIGGRADRHEADLAAPSATGREDKVAPSAMDRADPPPTPQELADMLAPTPVIQSDHPKIRDLAERLTAGAADPVEKARRLVFHLFHHIRKLPALSVPDAISTLENGMGDCNEHAMLLAALARAAGIPARVENGLVYDNGHFYFHAWNGLFLGEWIPADAALGQFPADVTHVRLGIGAGVGQMELLNLAGRARVKILSAE